MKRILIAVVCCAGAIGVIAQPSTFNFSNVPLNPRPIIGDIDGTGLGSNARVQFWAGPSPDSLEAIGDPIAFISGGIFNGPRRDVISVPADGSTPTFISLQAWIDDGSGGMINPAFSEIFSLVGGGSGNPTAVPAALVGLNGFCLSPFCVPEPSSYALALVGVGILFLRHRGR